MNTSDVIKRIEHLERTNRQWKLVCAGLLAVGVLLIGVSKSTAQQPSEQTMKALRVQELVLVDGKGKDRAVLSTKTNGSAMLAFKRQNGSNAAVLGVFNTGSGLLAFDDQAAQNALVLGYTSDGKFPLLQMHKGSNMAVDLSLDEKGNAGLVLKNRSGKEQFSAP